MAERGLLPRPDEPDAGNAAGGKKLPCCITAVPLRQP